MILDHCGKMKQANEHSTFSLTNFCPTDCLDIRCLYVQVAELAGQATLDENQNVLMNVTVGHLRWSR